MRCEFEILLDLVFILYIYIYVFLSNSNPEYLFRIRLNLFNNVHWYRVRKNMQNVRKIFIKLCVDFFYNDTEAQQRIYKKRKLE